MDSKESKSKSAIKRYPNLPKSPNAPIPSYPNAIKQARQDQFNHGSAEVCSRLQEQHARARSAEAKLLDQQGYDPEQNLGDHNLEEHRNYNLSRRNDIEQQADHAWAYQRDSGQKKAECGSKPWKPVLSLVIPILTSMALGVSFTFVIYLSFTSLFPSNPNKALVLAFFFSSIISGAVVLMILESAKKRQTKFSRILRLSGCLSLSVGLLFLRLSLAINNPSITFIAWGWALIEIALLLKLESLAHGISYQWEIYHQENKEYSRFEAQELLGYNQYLERQQTLEPIHQHIAEHDLYVLEQEYWLKMNPSIQEAFQEEAKLGSEQGAAINRRHLYGRGIDLEAEDSSSDSDSSFAVEDKTPTTNSEE